MRKSRRKNYTITIGITGADNHTGVTHLTIMLANYLVSKERCKVAVVDLSQQNSLMVLQKLYDERSEESPSCLLLDNKFRIHRVDYYSQATQRDIANILQLGYEYVVIDFGRVCSSDYNYEILRCHRRILIGSCCEWQQETFKQAIEKQQRLEDHGKWKYAAFLGVEEIRQKLEKRYRICINKIPYEEDPFRLHRNHFEPLKNMLQEASECL